jgi:hypothetical protein
MALASIKHYLAQTKVDGGHICQKLLLDRDSPISNPVLMEKLVREFVTQGRKDGILVFANLRGDLHKHIHAAMV